MKEIRNTYFKLTHEESKAVRLVSGSPLPDPNAGPYHFIDCQVHPRLWEACQQMYTTSIFTRTWIGVDYVVHQVKNASQT